MMKNRIVRLTAGAFSLFVLAISYGVRMDAAQPKLTKAERTQYRTQFHIKIDNTGNLDNYKASGEELVKKITEGINSKNERFALRPLFGYLNKAGSAKFKGDEYYKVASETLDKVKGAFKNKTNIKRLEAKEKELKDPKAREDKIKRFEKWRSERTKRHSARKANQPGKKPGDKQARTSRRQQASAVR